VTARTPAVNATGVAVGANVTATFNEAVTGVNGTTVQLRRVSNNALVAATVTGNNTTGMTLNPGANLAANVQYRVTLTGGAAAIRDLAGAPLATTTWTFTTAAANPPPTVTARTPAINATGVSRVANVTATFSEAVTGLSGTTVQLRRVSTNALIGAVVSLNGTSGVTLNPNATLAANVQYRVTLTGGAAAIRDLAGAPLATTTWTFTTGP
jgi:methionine-rich copper-binding protein CopC